MALSGLHKCVVGGFEFVVFLLLFSGRPGRPPKRALSNGHQNASTSDTHSFPSSTSNFDLSSFIYSQPIDYTMLRSQNSPGFWRVNHGTNNDAMLRKRLRLQGYYFYYSTKSLSKHLFLLLKIVCRKIISRNKMNYSNRRRPATMCATAPFTRRQ